MKKNNNTALSFLFFILAACSSLPDKPPRDYLNDKNIAAPKNGTFTFCSQYGCKRRTSLSLTQGDWADIDALFSRPTNNAKEEREKIAAAIGRFEQIIGSRTGTDRDKAGTFRNIGGGQLDCVDESTNTTTYLLLMDERGLLQHHTVAAPDTRFPLVHGGSWPHQTAVIIEKKSAERYVVDSWFYDNGAPATVVPLKLWKTGWKPDNMMR